MPLQILSEPPPDPEQVAEQMAAKIREALPGAEVAVRAASPGHFEVEVVSDAFAGKSRVAQQQLVYGAIAPLMSGSEPPIHAVDRLECRLPEAPA